VADAKKTSSGAAGAVAVGRKPRTVVAGTVTSAKTPKTLRVQVNYLAKHVKYGKYLRRKTVVAVHDEKGEGRLGDTVEVMECRPMSRTKHFRLVRVVKKAPEEFGAVIAETPIPGQGPKP
jgi:small subunit ribosomal protein S17